MRIPLRRSSSPPPGLLERRLRRPCNGRRGGISHRCVRRSRPPRRSRPATPSPSSLATSHNPSFLAPLGHVVDPDGPSGHVEGLASPVAPQVISGGPELPIAQRQASTSAGVNQRSVVQRLLTPRMWLSDSAGGAADQPPTAPTQTEPSFMPTEQPAPAVEDHPRQLATAPSPVPATTFTSAPEQDVARALPVVSAPTSSAPTSSALTSTVAAPSLSPVVSRHIADEHTSESAAEHALEAPATTPGQAVAPLLGDTAADSDERTSSAPDSGTDSSPSSLGPLSSGSTAAPVQRTVADAGPIRRPGLGAPLPSTPTSSAVPGLQRLPADPRATSTSPVQLPLGPPPGAGQTGSVAGEIPPVQRISNPTAIEAPVAHRHPSSSGARDSDAAIGGANVAEPLDAPVLGMSSLQRALDVSRSTSSAGSVAAQSIPGQDPAAPISHPSLEPAVQSPSVQRASRPLGLGAPLNPLGPALGRPVQRHVDTRSTGRWRTDSGERGGSQQFTRCTRQRCDRSGSDARRRDAGSPAVPRYRNRAHCRVPVRGRIRWRPRVRKRVLRSHPADPGATFRRRIRTRFVSDGVACGG